ncbi:MAG: prepilin-type N-terminal cleavage/methylation domain-containing protein [Phycisphaerales bacterium]|jgi:prepilin-type N-terminal cleavage/methylation domain-containing protein/prepilin-type processing-associated H-X9-DG protein|nr:prepilin-type N-terminal cleavage/methylation domain-containing protein [Phycisphaerales bacterium]
MSRNRRAFTLIELLVVIAIIALLIGILLPSLGAARESGRRTVCLSAQRMIALAATLYAEQHPNGAYLPTEGGGVDDLAWLVEFIGQPELAVCPSTKNFVDPSVILPESDRRNKYGVDVPLHLTISANNAYDDGSGSEGVNTQKGGFSFETWAWMSSNNGTGVPNGGWTMYLTGWYDRSMGTIDRNRQRGVKPGDPGYVARDPEATPGNMGILKNNRNIPRPNEVLLTLDSDQDHLATQKQRYPGALNNWPEEHNNHKADGVNISFLDGHAEFVRKGPGLIETYLRSNTTAANDVQERILQLHPGLKKESVRIGRNNWTRWRVDR